MVNKVVEKYLQSLSLSDTLEIWQFLDDRIVRCTGEIHKQYNAKVSEETPRSETAKMVNKVVEKYLQSLSLSDTLEIWQFLDDRIVRCTGEIHKQYNAKVSEETPRSETAKMVNKVVEKYLQSLSLSDTLEIWQFLDDRIVRCTGEIHKQYNAKVSEETPRSETAKMVNKVVEKYLQSLSLNDTLEIWQFLDDRIVRCTGEIHKQYNAKVSEETPRSETAKMVNKVVEKYLQSLSLNDTLEIWQFLDDRIVRCTGEIHKQYNAKVSEETPRSETAKMVNKVVEKYLQSLSLSDTLEIWQFLDDRIVRCTGEIHKQYNAKVSEETPRSETAKMVNKVVEKYLQSLSLSDTLEIWQFLDDRIVRCTGEIHKQYNAKVSEETPRSETAKMVNKVVEKYLQSLSLSDTLEIWQFLDDRIVRCTGEIHKQYNAKVSEETPRSETAKMVNKVVEKYLQSLSLSDTLEIWQFLDDRIVRCTGEIHKQYNAKVSEETPRSETAKMVNKVVEKYLQSLSLNDTLEIWQFLDDWYGSSRENDASVSN
ncbi:hypothetical protein CEXT_797721 [Caerostris extrusa]|uniref:Uncharacterized protein n=1 Tax=Caerostris extrusa TaxID=172846 RepID=A0AAV4N062_CAEEX|nr:hypothetical protein CEXT_797721 [Caerostris extrusa]